MAEWFAMVRLPIRLKKAMTVPSAKQAVNKEVNALASLAAWDSSRVRAKAEVISETRYTRKTFQFGSLMDLCHKKYAEFNVPDDKKVYKGRVVFRSDHVRGETCFYAVFTGQSVSPSTWLRLSL